MEKFTKGPWKVCNERSYPDGTLTADIYPEVKGYIGDICRVQSCECIEGEIPNVTAKANAHLLAAAPAMHYEIKSMCRAELELGTCLPSDCERCPMSKVLKKARGES